MSGRRSLSAAEVERRTRPAPREGSSAGGPVFYSGPQRLTKLRQFSPLVDDATTSAGPGSVTEVGSLDDLPTWSDPADWLGSTPELHINAAGELYAAYGFNDDPLPDLGEGGEPPAPTAPFSAARLAASDSGAIPPAPRQRRDDPLAGTPVGPGWTPAAALPQQLDLLQAPGEQVLGYRTAGPRAERPASYPRQLIGLGAAFVALGLAVILVALAFGLRP